MAFALSKPRSAHDLVQQSTEGGHVLLRANGFVVFSVVGAHQKCRWCWDFHQRRQENEIPSKSWAKT